MLNWNHKMIKILFFIVLSFLCLPIHAQYEFLNLRFNENYSYLKEDTISNWYKNFKYYSLSPSKNIFISQGGEVRHQIQFFVNEEWGDVKQDYTSIYNRLLYHLDFNLNNNLRVFTQINSTTASGRVNGNRSIDQNLLDIQQIFMDYSLNSYLMFRFGRQELLYGSQRLISVREGPNNRQSYDAFKLIHNNKNFEIDLFYSNPVRVKQGIFDDKIQWSEKLWGAFYLIKNIELIKNMDLYYLGYFNQNKQYFIGEGTELRHSLGLRIWNEPKKFKYDFEAVYQTGNWADKIINAYTASIDMAYLISNNKFYPKVGLKTEIISGDKSISDNKLNTFNPLFPRGAYFGLAALIGPSNLIDFHPSFSFKIISNLELSFDYDVFWRYSVNDGIYGPNTALLYQQNSRHSFIGHQFGLSLEYQPNSFLKLNPEFMLFLPHKYLEDISAGEPVIFIAFTSQLKF